VERRASFRERQQQERERAILEAAFELLMTRGPSAMTMDDVAGAVGISKATLYQHFPSKEELVASVAAATLAHVAATVETLDRSLPALQRIERAMGWIVQFRYDAEERFAVAGSAGFGATLKSLVWHHPRFRAQKERLIGLLAALIEEARAEGTVTDELPPRVIVQAMLALIRDFDYAELIEGGPVSGESLSQALVTIFLHGVVRNAPG
jgi:AcrR family transcriptional regulator